MDFAESALSTSKKAKDHPLLTGGGQKKMRSTTENVAGIAATAKALRLAMENQEAFASKTQLMKKLSAKNWPTIQMSPSFLVRITLRLTS